jgi:hypothetical protein
VVCRDAKCYQKLLEDKKKLQEYQDQVDCDLARKENLILIEDMIQDPRIDEVTTLQAAITSLLLAKQVCDDMARLRRITNNASV